MNSATSSVMVLSRSRPWLNNVPPRNKDVDGFLVRPETLPPQERSDWGRIAPTKIIPEFGRPRLATDDWPFLYLQDRHIPNLTIRSMVLLGAMGLLMVFLFLPKDGNRL